MSEDDGPTVSPAPPDTAEPAALNGEFILLGGSMACGLVFFALIRALILGVNSDRFADVPGSELGVAFLVGLRMDLSLLGFLLLPIWTLCFFPRWHWANVRGVRRATVGWIVLWTILLLFGAIADVIHFDAIDARLGASVIDDLRQPGILAEAVVNNPLILLLLLGLAALAAVAVRALAPVVDRLALRAASGRLRGVAALLILAALYASVRLDGDMKKWWGAAYFSGHHGANQLALNGTYNLFLAALNEAGGEASLRDRMTAMEEAEALSIVGPLLGVDPEAAAATTEAPLWRHIDTERPEQRLNVVLVMMESFEARSIGALGRRKTLSPEFDALASDGVLFTQHYAAGTRSNRALSAVLSSLPGLPGTSVLRSTRIQKGVFTLGHVLTGRGYASLIIQSGKRTLDNLQAYAVANGFERVMGREDFTEPAFETEWGVSDEDLFGRGLEEIDALHAAGRPFFCMLLTQSNHRPYVIPEGRIDAFPPDVRRAPEKNAFRYADWALGQFMEKASRAEWFEDTLFVLVADHGNSRRPSGGPDIGSFRIPLLLYAPAHVEPRRVDDPGGQVDVSPTILGILGGAYDSCFLGRDLLGPRPPRFAMMALGDELLWYEGDTVLVWSPNEHIKQYALEGNWLTPQPEEERWLAQGKVTLTRARAYARLAFTLPREGRYVPPAR